MKKWVILIVITIFTLNLSINGFSIVEPDIKVLLNGEQLSFDVKPKIINGRTLVPLRGIFEALGVKVDWDNSTKTITATKDSINIVLTLNIPKGIVNNKVVSLDVPPTSISGRTLVPLRFIGESLGIEVNWDNINKVVTLSNNIVNNTSTPIKVSPTATPIPASNVDKKIEEIQRHNNVITTLQKEYKDKVTDINNKIEEIQQQITPYWGSDYEYSTSTSELIDKINEIQSRINSLSSAAQSGDTEAQSKIEDYQSNLSYYNKQLNILQDKRTAQLKIRAYQDILKKAKTKYEEDLSIENSLHESNLQ